MLEFRDIISFMYITTVPNRNSRPAILLRTSYREDGKVLNKTLANLTNWDDLRIEAFKKMLKGEFDGLDGVPEVGESFGTIFLLKRIADEIGITKALGTRSKEALLSLFLVLARFAHQGSRLSSVKWAKSHAISDVLSVDSFDENHLYQALEWLEENQEKIELKLFKTYQKKNNKPPVMLLYDVTSSYFEGTENELAEYGYNRDKKKGKKQIVIGLLTDDHGEPLAVRVFKGNSADPSTIYEQIELVKSNFGIKNIVFVGDKGMIKRTGKEALSKEGWDYITTLSKVEIESLKKSGVLQYSFFEEQLCEVTNNGKRYILRKNGSIARKVEFDRNNRVEKLVAKIEERNIYVSTHKKAKLELGLNNIQKIAKEWRIDKFINLKLDGNQIVVEIDQDKKKELFALDGCYAIETQIEIKLMSKELVDKAYHNLHEVESNFSSMKTGLLEVRPIFLRKSNRTKGHVFVCMLALKIWHYMKNKLKQGCGVTKDGKYNVTIEEALRELDKVCFLYYTIKGCKVARLPKLSEFQQNLFNLFDLTMPQMTKSAK
ncbi:IS1634 family transposase [Candidatus Tisiphia endosymbiont of Thecophora atra]|uniref:IS1634 family transposase n=1 Tax=Candidatus Tisiphia endosymbiont of Thecophora atra TaxID=3066258 RepID=UPI00312C9010